MKIQDTYKDGQRYISQRGSYKVTIVAVEYRRESSEVEQKLFGLSAIEITYGFFQVRKDGFTPDKRKQITTPPESFVTCELGKKNK